MVVDVFTSSTTSSGAREIKNNLDSESLLKKSFDNIKNVYSDILDDGGDDKSSGGLFDTARSLESQDNSGIITPSSSFSSLNGDRYVFCDVDKTKTCGGECRWNDYIENDYSLSDQDGGEIQYCNNTTQLIPAKSFLKTNSTLSGQQLSLEHSAKSYKVSINILNASQDKVEGIFNIYGLTYQYNKISTYFTGCYDDDMDDEDDSTKYINIFKQLYGTDIGHHLSIQKQQEGQHTDVNRYVAMRWKEENLYLDFHKKCMDGVSFQGFYYLLLDNRDKTIRGFYYHPSAKSYQKLELSVENDEHVTSEKYYELYNNNKKENNFNKENKNILNNCTFEFA